jgi:hypothetical protein
MSYETQIFIQSISLYMLWIFGPLVPAILIYRLFPETKVAASGPFAGLTIRATGAFGAYITTLLIAYPLNLRLYSIMGSQLKPVWTLRAEVIASDAAGKPILYNGFYNGMRVSFAPDFQVMAGRQVKLSVPIDGDGRTWPTITIQVPNYGGVTIDPISFGGRLEVDDFHKEIRIHGPIPLERFEPIGAGLGSPLPN